MSEDLNNSGRWSSENIPESWNWAKFDEIFKDVTNSKKKLKQQSYLEAGTYPVIDQGQDVVGGYYDDDSLAYDGSLPVIIFGDHSRCVKFVETKFIQGADGVKVLKPTSAAVESFAYCMLSTIQLPDKGYSRHFKFLKASKFPLAPLNEQRRIVAKIEALKTRSQQVKEALEAIPPLLDQFRQSVLAAAFRGDLTADWREKNPDVGWETTTLEQVIKSKPRNGYSPKPVDYPTKVKSITLSATTSGKFKPQYFKYLDEEIAKDSHLWLTPRDILIQRSNSLEYVGTCAIYDGAFGEFIYPDLIMKVQVKGEKTVPEFIYYALSNQTTRTYFRKNATGTAGNMPKINQQIVMNTPIYLPPIEEQKEIVCRIEFIFKSADKIEQQYQSAKAYLDQLDQSILAKAFRGELVSQDPSDEPASILLERIQAEREKREAEAKVAKKSMGKTTGQRSRKAKQQDLESIQLGLPGLE